MKKHYGWAIVGCAFMTLCISNGLTLTGITAFDDQLLQTFGWSKGDLKLREFLQFTLAGLMGPFVGSWADRYGVRKLMVIGLVLLSVGLFAYAFIQSITHIYIIHVLFAGALGCAGLVVNILLISRWFTARRGTAIGLALVGTSLGNTVFAGLNAAIIDATSWQTAFKIIAVFPLLTVPLVLLFIKERPQDVGLEPFGGRVVTSSGDLPGMAFGDAVKTVNFWALSIAAMMTFYAILGAASNLFLYFMEGGISITKAGPMVGLVFLFGLIGKFIFGLLADYFNPKWVFIGNLAIMFVGGLFLASMNLDFYWPFVICFGLGWGGLYTMIQLLVVDSFGVRHAGKILGTITIMDAIGGGLGSWLTGVFYDRTGSYQLSFMVIAGLVGAALLISFAIRLPKSDAVLESAPTASPA